jgi:dTDP-glucose pyrophosphorylase
MQISYVSVLLAKSNDQTYKTNKGNILRSLLPFMNQSLIATAIHRYSSPSGLTLLVCSTEDHELITSGLESIPSLNNFKVVPIKQETKGALATLGWAIGHLPREIPVLVAPSDSLVLCDTTEFVFKMANMQVDAGIIVFPSENPKYSYVRTVNNKVVEIAEKVAISNNATAGVFFFRNSETLLKCIEWALLNRITTDGNYYLAPAINYLVSQGKRVSTMEIQAHQYLRFRTEEEFNESLTRIGDIDEANTY